MSLFYTASEKELLQIRNKIFLDSALPALQKNGYQRSPFSGSSFGWHPSMGYIYELCRLSGDNELETISVEIIKRDRWIQVYLNIFRLEAPLDSLDQLNNTDGKQFSLPPNSISRMRLKSDDIRGPSILSYDYMFKNHNLRSYYTKAGLARRAQQLERIISDDLNNIDRYVQRWHEIHKPLVTNWQGVSVK